MLSWIENIVENIDYVKELASNHSNVVFTTAKPTLSLSHNHFAEVLHTKALKILDQYYDLHRYDQMLHDSDIIYFFNASKAIEETCKGQVLSMRDFDLAVTEKGSISHSNSDLLLFLRYSNTREPILYNHAKPCLAFLHMAASAKLSCENVDVGPHNPCVCDAIVEHSQNIESILERLLENNLRILTIMSPYLRTCPFDSQRNATFERFNQTVKEICSVYVLSIMAQTHSLIRMFCADVLDIHYGRWSRIHARYGCTFKESTSLSGIHSVVHGLVKDVLLEALFVHVTQRLYSAYENALACSPISSAKSLLILRKKLRFCASIHGQAISLADESLRLIS